MKILYLCQRPPHPDPGNFLCPFAPKALMGCCCSWGEESAKARCLGGTASLPSVPASRSGSLCADPPGAPPPLQLRPLPSPAEPRPTPSARLHGNGPEPSGLQLVPAPPHFCPILGVVCSSQLLDCLPLPLHSLLGSLSYLPVTLGTRFAPFELPFLHL